MEIGWKLKRLIHLTRRFNGSLGIRGWRATLRRALRGRVPSAGTKDVSDDVYVVAQAEVDSARRILIVDSMTPDPMRDSGSMRLCQIFSLLNADGWAIDFFADDDDATQHDVKRLAAQGVRLHRGNPAAWLRNHGSSLDTAMLCRLPIADQYGRLVRRLAPRARIIFDTVDLHFVREQRAAALTGNKKMARRAARSRRRELAAIALADVTLVVSIEEQVLLANEAPQALVMVVSNIHDITGSTADFSARSGLLFIGGFGHPPNEDAVRWFIESVLPRLRAEDPAMVFHVVGDIDPAARRSIECDGVVVHGRVVDLSPLLSRVRLSVAPLRFGAGVKGKVNQAMSHGLPVVLTSIAAEGMYVRDGVNALIGDDAETMAKAIWRAYNDEDLWLRLSNNGLDNVRAHFSTAQARDALKRALIKTSI